MENEKWITQGFILAGCTNICGTLLFSRFFTNELLMEIDSKTFSGVGLGGIMLWGLAYIAIACCYTKACAISAVFALEKFFYTAVWVDWLAMHACELKAIYQQDILTGFFYSIYGVNDLTFGIFFLYAFIKAQKQKMETEND